MHSPWRSLRMSMRPTLPSVPLAALFATSSLLLVSAAWPADKSTPPMATDWDRDAAARYLDSREVWWQSWDRAQKDHGTVCVSCHTPAPFAMAPPHLHEMINEPGGGPTPPEKAMLASIEKRVRLWKDVQPFYSDALYGVGKEVE